MIEAEQSNDDENKVAKKLARKNSEFNETSYAYNLPNELWLQNIFSSLSVTTLLNVIPRVSQYFHNLANNNFIWEKNLKMLPKSLAKFESMRDWIAEKDRPLTQKETIEKYCEQEDPGQNRFYNPEKNDNEGEEDYKARIDLVSKDITKKNLIKREKIKDDFAKKLFVEGTAVDLPKRRDEKEEDYKRRLTLILAASNHDMATLELLKINHKDSHDIFDWAIECDQAEFLNNLHNKLERCLWYNVLESNETEILAKLGKKNCDLSVTEAIKKLFKNRKFINYLFKNIIQAEEASIYVWTWSIQKEQHDINLRNTDGKTALHLAVEKNDIKTVEILLNENDAKINILDDQGKTPFSIAVEHNYQEIMRFLKTKGADINNDIIDSENNTRLHKAIENNEKNVINYLLVKKLLINQKNNLGQTALHCAVANKNISIDIIKSLIDREFAVNEPDINGITPLHLAVIDTTNSRKTALIDLMLEKGGNLDVIDNNGDTLLHYAAKEGNHDIVKKLIRQKSTLANVKNKKNQTALHLVKNILIYNTLIESDVDISTTDTSGETALHHAARNNDFIKLKHLLHNSRSEEFIDVTNNKGDTALDIALEKRNKNQVEYLLSCGASFDKLKSSNAILRHHPDVHQVCKIINKIKQQIAKRLTVSDIEPNIEFTLLEFIDDNFDTLQIRKEFCQDIKDYLLDTVLDSLVKSFYSDKLNKKSYNTIYSYYSYPDKVMELSPIFSKTLMDHIDILKDNAIFKEFKNKDLQPKIDQVKTFVDSYYEYIYINSNNINNQVKDEKKTIVNKLEVILQNSSKDNMKKYQEIINLLDPENLMALEKVRYQDNDDIIDILKNSTKIIAYQFGFFKPEGSKFTNELRQVMPEIRAAGAA